MQDIQLSSREILYIASLSDAAEFYGIPDGFYGMDETEIAAEINNIKLSLTKKELAEMDFDGGFIVKDEIKNIIEVCANREQYISFDKIQKGKNHILRFYIKGNTIIKLSENENDYMLNVCSVDDVKNSSLSFVDWYEEKEISDSDVVVEAELLKKVKMLNEFDSPENELKLMGCSNIKSKILYSGLSGRADYYSLTYLDFVATEDSIKSLIFINSEDGILKLTPVIDEEREVVSVSSVSQISVIEDINIILSKALPLITEDFV